MTSRILHYSACMVVLAAAGCEGVDRPAADEAPAVRIIVSVRSRGNVRVIGPDTLSEWARILRVHPEPDGDAVAVLFADSARGISAGLALEDERTASIRLVWPDSVDQVWWSDEHELSFTSATGDGVYAVVDVHGDSLVTLQRITVVPPSRGESVDRALLGRAQRFVDSVRVQPTGIPQHSAMTYTVTALIPDPSGRLAAFYVAARDTLGRELNPSWYATHLRADATTLIDEIVGLASDLPRSAAGWTSEGDFIFAKGATLHEARVEVRPAH